VRAPALGTEWSLAQATRWEDSVSGAEFAPQLLACFGYWGRRRQQGLSSLHTPEFHNRSEEFGLTASVGGYRRASLCRLRDRDGRGSGWPHGLSSLAKVQKGRSAGEVDRAGVGC
jgi:hypothetical protein